MRDASAHPRAASRRLWRALPLGLCALFLASVARYYHPGLGFSALVQIPRGHEGEIPALQQLPHYEHGIGQAYDGLFYVQMAMVPLLRDPAIDRALDYPAYRARRILFSWTAYALGLGRPAWILQAYALQNVLCWLILAWWITRWLRPDTVRGFALWTGVMFSHGLLVSVRLALLDGPSLLLLACAAAAAERGRTLLTGAIVGIAGLGRETNLFGGVLLPRPRGMRGWAHTLGAGMLVVLPIAVWQDYVWSIYQGGSALAGSSQLTIPFVSYLEKWTSTLDGLRIEGFRSPPGASLLVMIALTVQAVFILWSRAVSQPWWRLAAAYVVLMLLAQEAIWEGHPGAITRVVLPLAVGFNILLARLQPRGFWIWCLLGNLHVLAGIQQMPIAGFPSP